MIVNKGDNRMEMEARDWDTILPGYVRGYMYYSKNVPPEVVVFPMFKEVVFQGMHIPVMWVEPESPIAVSIKEDGRTVPPSDTPAEPEVTNSAPARGTPGGTVVNMKPTIPDRAPRLPAGPIIPPGQSVDLTPRGASDLAQVRADLADQPDIDEGKQKPIELGLDSSGKKIIKE